MKAALCIFPVLGTLHAAQEAKPEVIAHLKAATALLMVPATEGSGSAFCISADGWFITCAHVVADQEIGDKVELTLNPGTKDQKKIPAVIARIERGQDLAVLKSDPVAITALPLGRADDLKETDPLVVAGYPFGNALQTGQAAAAITITLGHVTAIRRSQDKVDILQMDAELNPGNSGGPVIDLEGRVVGVAAAKITGTRLNFATSVRWVSSLLTLPRIQPGVLPEVDADKPELPLEVPFELVFLKPSATEPRVSATFSDDSGDGASVKPAEVRKVSPGHYIAKGVPAGAASGNVIRLDCAEQVGTVRITSAIQVLDRTIRVGTVPVKLSNVALLFPTEGRATQSDGTELRGAISGLDTVMTPAGDRYIADWAGMSVISVHAEPGMAAALACRIEVAMADEKQTLRVPLKVRQGSAAASGGPALGNPEIPPFSYPAHAVPTFPGESIDLKTDAEPDEVAWGGGGRYFVLRLPAKMKIVVVDCVEGRIVGSVPLSAADAGFTADGTDLLVADGVQISRWALQDLKPQGPPVKIVAGRILQLAAGSTWTRQLAMLSALPGTNGSSGDGSLELRDPVTGKVLGLPSHEFGARSAWNITASAISRTLRVQTDRGVWRNYEISSGQLIAERGAGSGDWWLDAGGRWVLGEGGTFASVNRPEVILGDRERGPVFPSTVPGLACRFWQPGSGGENNGGPPDVDVIDLGSGACLLHQALTLDEMMFPKAQPGGSNPVRNHKGPTCNLVPQFGIFVSMSWENSMVRVRKFDLWSALKAAHQPYLMVTGAIPDLVPAGTPFHGDPGTRGSGQIHAQILKAPPGVTVDESGILSWPAPKSGEGGEVLVRFSSNDGIDLLWRQSLWAR